MDSGLNVCRVQFLINHNVMSEFEKYARGYCGISSLKLHNFESILSSYVSPTIIEERQLNVATMDVFSRLMMDRIIFLGAPIYDDAANIIQAQLLFRVLQPTGVFVGTGRAAVVQWGIILR